MNWEEEEMKQIVRFQIEGRIEVEAEDDIEAFLKTQDESPLSLVERGVITRAEIACGEIDFGEYVVMPETSIGSLGTLISRVD